MNTITMQAPQEAVMALNLLELEKHLDNTLRHTVTFLGGPVWSQDSMILMDPF